VWADYQKPTFQVNISSDKANILNGDKVDFGLDATYYSGGNVGNASVDWFTEAVPYTFTPDPKYSQFNFTDWDQDQYYLPPQPAGQGGTLEQGSDTTDANGHLDLSKALSLGEKQKRSASNAERQRHGCGGRCGQRADQRDRSSKRNCMAASAR